MNQPNLAHPEWLRLQDAGDATHLALFNHLTEHGGLQDTYAVVIIASHTIPGAMIVEAAGIDEDDALAVLEAVLETTAQGNYRSLKR